MCQACYQTDSCPSDESISDGREVERISSIDKGCVPMEEWLVYEDGNVLPAENVESPILDVGAEVEDEVVVKDDDIRRLEPVAGSSAIVKKRRRPRHGLDLSHVVGNDGYSLRRHMDRHPGLGNLNANWNLCFSKFNSDLIFVLAVQKLEEVVAARGINDLKCRQARSERKVQMVKEKRERERLAQGNLRFFRDFADKFEY